MHSAVEVARAPGAIRFVLNSDGGVPLAPEMPTSLEAAAPASPLLASFGIAAVASLSCHAPSSSSLSGGGGPAEAAVPRATAAPDVSLTAAGSGGTSLSALSWRWPLPAPAPPEYLSK